MLDGMSAPAFYEWLDYDAREPRVAEMLPWLFASVCAAIWNVQIAKGTKPGREPQFLKLRDFVLQFGDMPDPRTEQTTPKNPTPPQEVFERVVDGFAVLGWKPVKDHRPVPRPEGRKKRHDGH